MVIGVDLDGVVFDTIWRFQQWCLEQRIKDFKADWMVCDLKSAAPQHFDNIHKTFLDPAFIRTIPFVPGAKRGLREMAEKDGHEIFAISGRGEEVSEVTRELLKSILPPERIFCIGWKNRAQGKADLCRQLGVRDFVEDDPNVAQTLALSGIKVYMFDQAYNFGINNFEKVYSWSGLRARLRGR